MVVVEESGVISFPYTTGPNAQRPMFRYLLPRCAPG